MYWLIVLMVLPTGETRMGDKLGLFTTEIECTDHLVKPLRQGGYTYMLGCIKDNGERIDV